MRITAPPEVFEGLEAILDADDVNEYHHREAQRFAFMHDYHATAAWIRRNPVLYGRGLETGQFDMED